MKKCNRCRRTLSLNKFYKGGTTYCKACDRKSRAIRKKQNLCRCCRQRQKVDGKKYCNNCVIIAKNPELLRGLNRLYVELEKRNANVGNKATTFEEEEIEYDYDDLWAANKYFQQYGKKPSLMELEAYIEGME